MPDPRIAKLADVLVNYSVSIQPKDKIAIMGSPVAEPLLEAVVVEVLKAGGYPLSIAQLPGVGELTFRHASEDQLQHIPEPMRVVFETYDAIISLMSSVNTKAMSNVPPEKLVLANRAQQGLMKTMMQRTANGEFRWVGTLYPTHAYAQDAEMGLVEYEDFVYAACLPDFDNPVSYWRNVETKQQKIVDWLVGKDELRVEGNDVDLRMKITARSFINCCGKRNMPDGEVFTGPVEDSVEGHVRFSYPTTYQGRKLEGVQLWFEKGRVVKATADKGEEFLAKTIDIDEGARFVGEFAIGTNKGITRATGNTLYDEKINGSFHMALGAGMPETGSVNESAIHWDMVCDLIDGGRIWVDDELIYENGDFVIGF
jgi:aminopeptidase